MESIAEKIKVSILSVLPHLSEETAKPLSIKLADEIGVTEISDLSLVTIEDLNDLKPMDRRKILRAWKSLENPDISPSGPHIIPEPVTCSISETCTSSQQVEISLPSENWDKFEIPWQQMPIKLMNSLKAGDRPTPPLRKKLTQTVADSMYKVTRRPGRRAIGIVSNKIVQSFPALKDTLCGDSFGSGDYSIFKSIENRIDYLNRGLGKKQCKRVEIEDPEESPAKFSRYGCINWQPIALPENETNVTQTKKREEMVSLLSQGPGYNKELMISLIIDTYYSQRKDINSRVGIEEMLKCWPALFTQIGMIKHFELLVGYDVKERFKRKLDSKGIILINCLRSSIKTSCKEAQDQPNCSAALVITLLMAHFKEDKDSIFRLANVCTTRADAVKLNLPATPCLIVCGQDLFNAELFMLSIDGQIVNDYLKNFEDAFLMLFASFYVFNICYTISAGSTLEFIQRCFANINPNRGSKKDQRKGKKSPIDPRVLTLLSMVRDEEWLYS